MEYIKSIIIEISKPSTILNNSFNGFKISPGSNGQSIIGLLEGVTLASKPPALFCVATIYADSDILFLSTPHIYLEANFAPLKVNKDPDP